MLVGNKIVVCVIVQKKYFPLMSLTAYRAAGLGAKMPKDNIEMDIKEMPLKIKRAEINFINTYSKYHHF
jgi:hypothetical protein